MTLTEFILFCMILFAARRVALLDEELEAQRRVSVEYFKQLETEWLDTEACREELSLYRDTMIREPNWRELNR